jgi:hypothetical protein
MLGFLGDMTSVPCHATMQSTSLVCTWQCTWGILQQLRWIVGTVGEWHCWGARMFVWWQDSLCTGLDWFLKVSSCWKRTRRGPVGRILMELVFEAIQVGRVCVFGELLIIINCCVLTFWSCSKVPSWIEPSSALQYWQLNNEDQNSLISNTAPWLIWTAHVVVKPVCIIFMAQYWTCLVMNAVVFLMFWLLLNAIGL